MVLNDLLVFAAIFLKDIIIGIFILIKVFEKCTLRIEPAINPFVDWFKATTLRKSNY